MNVAIKLLHRPVRWREEELRDDDVELQGLLQEVDLLLQ